jgi:hypothetical protein
MVGNSSLQYGEANSQMSNDQHIINAMHIGASNLGSGDITNIQTATQGFAQNEASKEDVADQKALDIQPSLPQTPKTKLGNKTQSQGGQYTKVRPSQQMTDINSDQKLHEISPNYKVSKTK